MDVGSFEDASAILCNINISVTKTQWRLMQTARGGHGRKEIGRKTTKI
jgi:hypothetical protein